MHDADPAPQVASWGRGESDRREDDLDLTARFVATRRQTTALCEPLAVEDYGVQPMDDASPPKWHLAHTTWFFETFLLKPFLPGYEPYHPAFEYLFNSYYNGVGNPWPRARRGMLSRPTVAEVREYRQAVETAMAQLLEREVDIPDRRAIVERTVLGLHHEQQHQELLVTDIKYNFGLNPLRPRLIEAPQESARAAAPPLGFTAHEGGPVEIGADRATGTTAFCFDNEQPRHQVLLRPFELGDRLITNEEYLAFMADGGYRTPALWLSDGWSWVSANGISAPLYWSRQADQWVEYRLSGEVPLRGEDPVAHISFYEADAYARWAGCRLPLETEWEVAACGSSTAGNFQDSGGLHPRRAAEGSRQLFGDLWEWTASPYMPYPGYQPLPGTLGEYNGKFMSNQLVLRGGSCATPGNHIRVSYRNFFYPPDRWQFTGIRLARDAG